MESFSVIEYIGNNFTVIIDHLGTFAFAISGIRLAVTKQFDWFGAYVVGFITAIGGGTTRDLLLGVTPFWMLNASYLIVTAIGLISFVFFRRMIERMTNTIFLFDAIGLGLFTVVGIEKSLAANYPFWIAIIMGMITGSLGGVLRDIAINEVPLIFRREIYALACVAGGVVYTLCVYLGLSVFWINGLSATTVIVIRILANRFHIQLPTVK